MRIPVPNSVEDVLNTALDRALSVQHGAVTNYVEHIRDKNPHDSPAQILEAIESHYIRASVALGAGAGAAAAFPGIGTAASLAAGAAEIAAFVEATSLYTLAAAHVHGLRVEDPEQRRALVMAVMLGESGIALLESSGGKQARWGEVLNRKMNKEAMSGINKRLAKHFIKRFGARQGALLAGRALPLGIGAGIGAIGNRTLARSAIKTSRKAFGPPPAKFGPVAIG